MRTGILSWGKGWGVRLTTNLLQLPRSRMRGAITLLPLYAFISGRGKSLPFLDIQLKFLADKTMPEYLHYYHICEFRAHAYYIGPMKCKSAISSQKYTAPIVTDLQVTAESFPTLHIAFYIKLMLI
jgi:hypothetical protein